MLANAFATSIRVYLSLWILYLAGDRVLDRLNHRHLDHNSRSSFGHSSRSSFDHSSHSSRSRRDLRLTLSVVVFLRGLRVQSMSSWLAIRLDTNVVRGLCFSYWIPFLLLNKNSESWLHTCVVSSFLYRDLVPKNEITLWRRLIACPQLIIDEMIVSLLRIDLLAVFREDGVLTQSESLNVSLIFSQIKKKLLWLLNKQYVSG